MDPSVPTRERTDVAKALVITEKPSVARDIVSALGGFTEHDGYWEGEDFVVTFAVGHLLELLEPEEIDARYKRWTLADLPILPEEFRLKKKKGQSERLRTIEKLLRRKDVERVVNACDAGREGELIFREIVKFLGNEKPIERLWLQSMTADAIRAGFASLRPDAELRGLAAAAECRAFSDWLIGMNATRALTKRLKTRREKTAWSAGRVQTPTLALLVEREAQVLAHVPRPYWRLTARFERDGASWSGVWYDPAFRADPADDDRRDDRLFDEARALAIAAAVEGREGRARETRKPSREAAPPLFDLTSLQREANRRFSWSAKRTLGAAQRCYEQHKILTYPRTDSRFLPADYRRVVDDALRAFARGGEFAPHARRLLERGLENAGRIFDDAKVSDHFAIIPTGNLPGAGLSNDDRRLFDLVMRRFLGAFHPPALWERVERVVEVSGEHFRTRARALMEPGWREVLPPPAPAAGNADEEETGVLPPLLPGATEAQDVPAALRGVEVSSEETKPPPRLSEARLLSLMENAGQSLEDEDLAAALHEKGLGTPATRAEIIENLIAKGYAVRLGKALRPTVKGIRLIDTLRRVHIDRLASPALTGEIEQHLADVEKGRRRPEAFLDEMREYAREIVEAARSFEYEQVYADLPALGACPVCGRDVYEQAWFYRCSEDPPRDPDCAFRIWKDTSGRYIDRAAVAALLRDGRTGSLDGFTARDGRTYRGHLEIDREENRVVVRSEGFSGEGESAQPEYDVNPEPLGTCPTCGLHPVVETPTRFVCAGRLAADEEAAEERRLAREKGQKLAARRSGPKPCGFALPRTVCKREITREEALPYLQNGRTELLEDFTSRFGRPFSAVLVRQESGRHGFEFPPRGVPARGRDESATARAEAKPPKPPRRRARREQPAKPPVEATTARAPRAPRVRRKRPASGERP